MTVYFNLKTSKESNAPYFAVWDKESKTSTSFDTVDGEFVKFYVKQKEITKKTGGTFKVNEIGIVLKNSDDEHVITFNQDSFLGRAFLNVLLNWEELGKLIFRVWRGKTGWDNVTITNNYNGIVDEKWFPKYPASSDKYKELIKVFTKSDGTSIKDFGPLNQFLWEEAQKLIPATGVQSTQEDLTF